MRKRDADVAVNAAWPLGGLRKRVLDLVVAGLALIVLAPLVLVAAVLVRLAFGRPVLESQECMGFSGRAFACYAFRTTSATQQPPWAEDVGVALRASGLDQLPRLFNVLRGDMSVVGPQPTPAADIVRHPLQVVEILRARPGLTGMWLSCKGNRIALDRYYVRHWSIGLDAALLRRAILVDLRADTSHPAGLPYAGRGASKHRIT